MPYPVPPIWRDDIDALTFRPDGHDGLCMMHRRAFRVLLRAVPTPRQCEQFFLIHRDAFQAAADAKLRRVVVGAGNSFHVTSRDIRRQLKN